MPNYRLPGFKAVQPQLAINILHSYMWTRVIFTVLKMLANYNKIPPEIAVHATIRVRCCSESSFSIFNIRSEFIFAKRSS